MKSCSSVFARHNKNPAKQNFSVLSAGKLWNAYCTRRTSEQRNDELIFIFNLLTLGSQLINREMKRMKFVIDSRSELQIFYERVKRSNSRKSFFDAFHGFQPHTALSLMNDWKVFHLKYYHSITAKWLNVRRSNGTFRFRSLCIC